MKHQDYLTAEQSSKAKPQKMSNALQQNETISKEQKNEVSPGNSASAKKTSKNIFAGRYGLEFLL